MEPGKQPLILDEPIESEKQPLILDELLESENQPLILDELLETDNQPLILDELLESENQPLILDELLESDNQSLILADLSWPEVEAIRDEVEVVLIPVGSNEQHGPNLALSMDITGATQFCNRASAMAYPKLMVAPSLPWGVSYHHMNFPGTITVSAETFIQTLVEVVSSLQQHGFQRFMIVNGHGGNTAALGNAVVRINEELAPTFVGSAIYFSFADEGIDEQFGIEGITGHACEMETSAAMYLAPEIVKSDALAAGEMTQLTHELRPSLRKYGVAVPYRFDRYTTNGALGDARNASLEYGQALMESALNNFVAFMDEIINWPLNSDESAGSVLLTL